MHRFSGGSRSGPRVALVSLHTSPLATAGSGDAGGMNVFLRALADGLVADGFDVDVLTRRTDPRQTAVITPGGARMLFVDAGPAAAVAKEDLPALVDEFAARAIEEGPYDIVHSHYWLSGVAGERLAAASGAPHLVTLHTLAALKNELLADDDRPEPAERVAAERRLLAGARAVLAVSRAEADAAIRLAGAEPERVRVVHPGVDTRMFHADLRGGDGNRDRGNGDRSRDDRDRDDRNRDDGDGARDSSGSGSGSGVRSTRPRVVVAARIQPLKGHDLAVRAVAALPRDTRPQLVLAGDATESHAAYVAALHALIGELSLSAGPIGRGARPAGTPHDDGVETGHDTDTGADVVFVGPLERGDLAETLRHADALLIPSHSETFGLVALEAAASGIPVIAARVGGLPEAVGDNGVLLDDREPATWAAALDALLAERRTLEGRTRQRERALAHAAPFRWDAVAHRVGDIYRSLL